jgi:hypothetical protein
MDPDACLKELLELSRGIGGPGWAYDDQRSAERMAELIEALDGWITKGGFLPQRWASTTVP